jgi:hypothetical protein
LRVLDSGFRRNDAVVLDQRPLGDYLYIGHNDHMRSTRATAAIARLNARSAGRHYTMALTGNGLFILRERLAGEDRGLSAALALDEFVQLVDSLGPKKEARITKSEAAFMKQLIRKDGAP